VATPAAAAPVIEPQAKSKKKVIVMIGAALMILMAGCGTTYYIMQKKHAELQEAATEEDEEAQQAKKKKNDVKKKNNKKVVAKEAGPPVEFYPVEPWFTFNLMDKDPERTGQIGIVYEIADKKAGEALKHKLPVIRSKILLSITGKQAQDIRTPDGKQKLADEILGLTRGVLERSGFDEGIKAVHFSIFVIQ
jgi:flagellar protein FliL